MHACYLFMNTAIFAQPPAAAVKRLLSEAHLSIIDIDAQHPAHFFGCDAGELLVGVVGLQFYDDIALLRSLAVAADCRGAGLGGALVAHAEQYASHRGTRSIYLLTHTAESFFTRLGYVRVSRDQAPAAIRNTQQFSELCPASSALMFKHLLGYGAQTG